jgi:hypothetical protein
MPTEVADPRRQERGAEDPGGVVVDVARRRTRGAREDVSALQAALLRPEDCPHRVVHRNAAGLAVLRPWDGDDTGGEVDVLPAELELFRLAKPGVERDRHHGPLAFADRFP